MKQGKSASTKHDLASSPYRAELERLAGSNPVLSGLIRRGRPLTKQEYMRRNWGSDGLAIEDIEDEEELEVLQYLADEESP